MEMTLRELLDWTLIAKDMLEKEREREERKRRGRGY
jgi:hypothetical protein